MNTKKIKKGKDINNDFIYLQCQRRKHLCSHFNSNLPTIKQQFVFEITMPLEKG